MQDNILKDSLKLNENEELRKTLYGDKNFETEKISFSCNVKKLNKKNVAQDTLFVISNFGQIDLLSQTLKVRHTVKIHDLKSLMWIIDDIDCENHGIGISAHSTFDYKVECHQLTEKDNIFKALKYFFWKYHSVNLPIYQIPRSNLDRYFNSKRVPIYMRINVPEKFRMINEDIYPEQKKQTDDSKAAEMLKVDGDKPLLQSVD